MKSKLTKAEFERLEVFFYRKTSKTRMILYLIALGFSVGELVKLTAKELRALDVNDGVQYDKDMVLEGLKPGQLIFRQGEEAMPHTAFYRILRYAGEQAINKALTQETFRGYIKNK